MPRRTVMTPKAHEALSILSAAGKRGMSSTEFAGHMWPDAHGWKKVSRAGAYNAARRGCGMWRAAGSWLWKLERKGLVWCRGGVWTITISGAEALKEDSNAKAE